MASTAAEIRERQENEVEAIKAIYANEVTDLRKGGGFTWELPIFSIKIFPQRGSSFGVAPPDHYTNTSVRLVFQFPLKYPDVIPEMKIEDVKGLSDDEVSELKSKLTKLAKDSLGEVMVLNLAQYTEAFLYEHQKRPTGSFYDEMLKRKKLLEEQHNQVKDEQEKRIQFLLKEEIQRKQDMLREEVRKRKELQLLQDESMTSSMKEELGEQEFSYAAKNQTKLRGRRTSSLKRMSECSDVSESGDTTPLTLDFNCLKSTRTFQRGEFLGCSPLGSKVYAGMDFKSGTLVAISEYAFHLRLDKKNRVIKETPEGYTMESLMKQLNLFEMEFKLLLKLDHPNLSSYIGSKTTQEDNATIIFRVAQEFLRGTILQSYLQENVTLDLGWIRNCANGVLQGLEYLHSNNIVHRYLRDTSIFLDHSSEVKITDYGLERKLNELHHTLNGGEEIVDKFAPSIGRGAKKGDIYRFGILILSLVKGEPIAQNPPEIPSTLPTEFQDFLKNCLTNNENARWNAAQLLEHTFLKLPILKLGQLRLPRAKDVEGKQDAYSEAQDQDDSAIERGDKSEVQGFTSHIVKGHSRLQTEFEVLVWLGRGAFGDVLKVRNKLDGRVYALKRIKLNPKNKVLNKKITREVKLLSQLNHENVVRYFNSWMETVLDYDSSEATTEETRTTPTTGTESGPPPAMPAKGVHFEPVAVAKGRRNSLDLSDNIEALAPPVERNTTAYSDWSVSASAVGAARSQVNNNDDSDESSEDEDDIFGTSFLCAGQDDDDESDNIMFEASKGPGVDNQADSSQLSSDFSDDKKLRKLSRDDNNTTTTANEVQFMYIQMEFCEKSTLRTAIDCGLYLDKDRTWRLFREIIEGLAHIHQQGMIHRDLKPVNIFLDCNDNVKIGDFGLATGMNLQRNPGEDLEMTAGILKSDLHNTFDESHTGQVGTRSYIAVELLQSGAKAMYNQKVDIYSLGIIFFEMIYHPVETGMERVRILAGLRQPQVTFPPDFDELTHEKETKIVRWLLKHEPSERPTSAELLQSELIPPPQMEEAEIQEVFRFTLSNPQSKAYKYLMRACFKQSFSPADEIIYTSMEASSTSFSTKSCFKLQPYVQRVKDIMTSVFRAHGAIELTQCPHLLPKSNTLEGSETTVELMTSGGQIVRLPHDLRIPFAHYVVSNNIMKIKRYSIEKVYRERKVFGFHPRELVECSFDMVSLSQGSLLADAEVLSIVFEILNQLPWMQEKSCTIQLGHTNLLKAILIHFSIPEPLHRTIFRILSDLKVDKRSKSQIQTHLVSLALPDQFITLIFNLLEMEGSLSKVSNILKGIVKKKGEAASLVKEGLHELEVLVGHIETFGLKCNIVITPTLVFGHNIYNGLLYQVICDLKARKNRKIMDVIAAGGHYDLLLEKLRKNLDMSGLWSKEFKQYGVGISLSLDKLVSGLDQEQNSNSLEMRGFRSVVEVIICSFGNYSLRREKVALMKEFWSLGIPCVSLEGTESLEAAEDECREVGAKFLIILKDSELVGHLRLRCFEKDRVQEKKLSRPEVVEYIKRACRYYTTESNDSTKSEGIKSVSFSSSSETTSIGSSTPSGGGSGRPLVNITFILSDGKEKNTTWKRRQENQMITHLSEVLTRFSKQHLIELVGLEANSTLINTMSSYFQVGDDKEQFNKNVADFLDNQSRQRRYMKSICDEIYDLLFEKHSTVIILFGILDNSYRVIL